MLMILMNYVRINFAILNSSNLIIFLVNFIPAVVGGLDIVEDILSLDTVAHKIFLFFFYGKKIILSNNSRIILCACSTCKDTFWGAVTLEYEFTDKNRKPRKEIVKKHNGNISWCLHVVIL